MKTHQVTYGASGALQIVRGSGRGYISLLTISHAEAAAQKVTIYAGDGSTRLAEYIVDPIQSPYTLVFPLGFQLWFDDGLKLLTGSCVVNLTVVY